MQLLLLESYQYTDPGDREMNQPNQGNVFSYGSQLADVVLASGVPQRSWAAIQELNDDSTNNLRTTSSSPLPVSYKICDDDEKKCQIIAFDVRVAGISSVLSPTLEQNPPEFDFLQIKKNSQFSINEEALTLFRSLLQQDETLFQLNPTKPLIITGYSIGGWVASLFCLWLLNNIKQSNRNLPVCITFGSPLLGDDGLCRAIQSRSGWNARFLHVVSCGELIPRTFLSSTENIYKPFGTFLICSSSSSACACFNDPVSVLDVLATTGTDGSSQIPNLVDYGKLLEDLTHQIIVSNSKAVSQLWSSLPRGNPLRAGIILQLDAIGVRNKENNEEDTLITGMEERERKIYQAHVKRISDTDKKLNDSKIYMAQLEWYKKKATELPKMGYYDSFKNKEKPQDIHVVKYKIGLTKYWEEVVTEAEMKPRKQGDLPLPMRQLSAGTNYRRMAEPLDIAKYYKEGKTNYRTEGRDKHYELLETWHEEQEKVEEQKKAAKQEKAEEKKKRESAATLTEDSCFWADVEEALILTKSLKNREAVGELEPEEEKLNKFEEHVMGLIDDMAVSPEIFLETTFMRWWKEYETIPKRNHGSRLANYMKNKSYQNYK